MSKKPALITALHKVYLSWNNRKAGLIHSGELFDILAQVCKENADITFFQKLKRLKLEPENCFILCCLCYKALCGIWELNVHQFFSDHERMGTRDKIRILLQKRSFRYSNNELFQKCLITGNSGQLLKDLQIRLRPDAIVLLQL